MAWTSFPSLGEMSKGKVMFVRPLVNSTVGGPSKELSRREQMPKILAMFCFLSIVNKSVRNACIGLPSRGVLRAAWVNSYGVRPFSLKRQALALTSASSLQPLLTSQGTATESTLTSIS